MLFIKGVRVEMDIGCLTRKFVADSQSIKVIVK